jgi:hypothetical protein
VSETIDTHQEFSTGETNTGETNTGLAEPLAGPPEHAILVLEIMWAFHDMLGHDHCGQTAAALAARQRCIDHAADLRAVYDHDPEQGPGRADATIAWAVHNARSLFDRAVHPDDWQYGQGRATTGFEGSAAAA